MSKYMAYCGLYCGACWSMICHDKQEGVESAVELHTDADEQPCGGCRDIGQSQCEFVVCNKNHGTQCCAFCPEFPCQRIKEFSQEEWEHHQVVLANLQRIRETGVENWLQEQAEYWSCPACGCRTKWYQESCSRCGGNISRRI